MSSTDHIDAARALFVLALEPEDAEYREAWAHAAQCERCQRLLEEHQALLMLLDDELQASIPSHLPAGFEARVSAAIVASGRMPGWATSLLMLGALVSILMAAYGAVQAPVREMHVGGFCIFYEQCFAAGAFALGAVFAKRYISFESPWQSALLSMGGALAGQSVLMMRCEANGAAEHLLLFHVLGVAAATAVGALAVPRVTRLLRTNG